MARLLITGASGFLGRACLAALVCNGQEVHVVSRHPIETRHGIHQHRANLLDVGAVAGLVAHVRPTHLLHLAWVTGPGHRSSQDNHAWYQASRTLFEEFARHGGQRAVLIGSGAEYWPLSGIHEESAGPLRPDTVYGTCKHSLNEWVQKSARHHDISLAWARLFSTYGPYENARKLIPQAIHGLLLDQSVPCTSGLQEFDFIHVADAADALMRLLESSLIGTVNIGSGIGTRVRDVIGRLECLAGRSGRWLWGQLDGSGEPIQSVANVSRLRNELAWHPYRSLDDGLRDTLDFWIGKLASNSRS